MATIPRSSIIVPTYNRASYLALCLEALVALDTDPATFEILVVDNNSTDNTRDLVAGFAQAHPALCVRYLLEPKQGVSNARNRALAEARGPILYFLDDDSVAPPGWLNRLEAAFDDPEVGCAGGPAFLDFQGQAVPPWLQGDLKGLVGGYGMPYDAPTSLSRLDEFPWSCNLALRQEALAPLAPFRHDLGRVGKVKLTGGETELIHRVYKAGWKVMYLPGADVRHLVSPEQLEKPYLYKVGYGHAASHIILTADPRPHKVLRWFASDAWYATRRLFWLVLSLLRRNPLWFDDYMRFWMIAMRLPVRLRAVLGDDIVPSD